MGLTQLPGPSEYMQDDFTPGAIYKRLLSYSLRYWKVFTLGIVGMVAFAAADTTLAWIIKPLMDEGFVNRDPVFIRWMPVGLLGIFLWRGVASYVTNYSLQWVGSNVIKELRKEVFEHYLKLPTSFYEQNTSGSLIAKITFHIGQVAQSVTVAFIAVVKDGLTVFGLICLMIYLSPRLAMFALIGGPFIAFVMIYVSKRFRRYSSKIQNSMSDLTHVSEEAINGHRVIKIFGGQEYEREHFGKVNELNRRLGNKMARAKELSTPLIQMIGAVAIAVVIYYATSEQGEGALSPGTFIAFFGAMIGIMGPLRRLSGVNATVQKGIAAASSVFELLAEAIEEQGGSYTVERANGALTFSQLSFRYPQGDKLVLQDIDLEVQPGQMVAFVGRSGSGKSTLLGLVPRFYDCTGGRILLDGRDIRDYHLSNLRDQIALVDQNVILFNDTVAKNIAYGNLAEIDHGQIIEAAKAANAWEFIKDLPEGLNTEVGQHGVLLSGGQRQRLAIARALLKDAPILILDEATSALDTESERKIQDALAILMRGRTTLVIAHRLSTVQEADMIVVMDNGRMVESGRHDELLAKDGHYAALYRVQLSDSE